MKMLAELISRLEFGFLITVFSMAIVFSVLIVLMYIIRLQTFVLNKGWKKPKAQKKNDVIVEKKDIPVVEKRDTPVLESPQIDYSADEEIAAAIVAAICAYTNQASNDFRITGIKRVSGNDSSWRKAGII
jgi:glutaconyl-CoA/methylmalonyl-CoA decarboxylase subunit delta